MSCTSGSRWLYELTDISGGCSTVSGRWGARRRRGWGRVFLNVASLSSDDERDEVASTSSTASSDAGSEVAVSSVPSLSSPA